MASRATAKWREYHRQYRLRTGRSKGTPFHLRAFKHGFTGTPEYNAWILMKARCHNKNHPRYKEWGGRGIKVCDEWRSTFLSFYNHIGPRPSPNHSIDRINGDKGYEPGNIRWATAKEQSNNRPTWCHYLTFNGRTLNTTQWSEELGITREKIKDRIRRGWSIEKTLSTP